MSDVLNIALLISAVCFGAAADGFNERGLTHIGHPLEAMEKVLLLLAGIVTGSWLVIISYIAFRISLFDIIKNIAKKDPIFYQGHSSTWDKFLRKFPTHGVTFARVIFLAFAIGFTIKEF